jgi:hypothetical protein
MHGSPIPVGWRRRVDRWVTEADVKVIVEGRPNRRPDVTMIATAACQTLTIGAPPKAPPLSPAAWRVPVAVPARPARPGVAG